MHDSHEVTLDPVWNDTTYVPLPVPVSSSPTCAPLSAEVLLREYWSRGTVKVEVLDGDRFNEDTHLGEVRLLIARISIQ